MLLPKKVTQKDSKPKPQTQEQKINNAYGVWGSYGPKTERDQNIYDKVKAADEAVATGIPAGTPYTGPYLNKKNGGAIIKGSQLRRQGTTNGLRTSKKHK